MLLAIETATRRGSVAVAAADGEIVEAVALGDRNQARALAPTVARLLEVHGEITGYAVDVGPGSFTGLRVGLAFLKGLARARPAPVAAFGSLELLAADLLGGPADRRAPAAGEGDRLALAVLKASGGQVFAGLYAPSPDVGAGPGPDVRLPVGLYPGADLLARLAASLGPSPAAELVAGGDGLGLLDAAALDLLAAVDPEHEVPGASTLARLAAPRLRAGLGVSASDLEPAYHQLSAAEEMRARDSADRTR